MRVLGQIVDITDKICSNEMKLNINISEKWVRVLQSCMMLLVGWWWCGILEYWSTGILEYWSTGILEYWSASLSQSGAAPACLDIKPAALLIFSRITRAVLVST